MLHLQTDTSKPSLSEPKNTPPLEVPKNTSGMACFSSAPPEIYGFFTNAIENNAQSDSG